MKNNQIFIPSILCVNLVFILLASPIFGQQTADDFLNVGNEHQRQRNSEAAINSYTECLRLKPDTVGCLLNRASVLLSKSKGEPIKQLEITADALTGKTNQKLNIGGGSEVKNETRRRALADVNKIIQFQPKNAEAFFLRARIYTSESVFDKAIADFRFGLTLDENNQSAKSDLIDSEKRYSIRLRMSAGAMAMSAVYADEAGDKTSAAESYRQAVELYTKALEVDMSDGATLRGRAGVYRNLKNYEKAAADYTQALLTNPVDGESLVGRAESYAEQKKQILAVADYEKALALPATSANKYFIQQGLIGRGRISLDAGQTDAAIADFNKVLGETPNNVFALFQRGRAYAKKNDLRQATADFQKALEISPQFEEAKAEFAKILAQARSQPDTLATPQTAENFAKLGRQHLAQKNYDAAIRSFTDCLRLQADSQACYTYRGATFGLNKNMIASKADFDKALRIKPNVAEVYFIRGMMFKEIGEKQSAAEDFRTVLKIDMNNKQAQEALQALDDKR